MSRPPCPKCNGVLVFKHGSYKLRSGATIQRWFCQTCRKGFNPGSTIQEIPSATSETSAVHPKCEM